MATPSDMEEMDPDTLVGQRAYQNNTLAPTHT
jgi:hypothetical protein